MPLNSTSLSSWAKAIKKALDGAGCNGQALLQEAGLELPALDDPDARYPVRKTARLWQLAVEATGDANFGLKVASQVNQTTFHALGPTLTVSATLGEAFDRIVRYFRLVSDAAELDFRKQGGGVPLHHARQRRPHTASSGIAGRLYQQLPLAGGAGFHTTAY